MNKKLLVFSADALVSEDLEILKDMPNFKTYLEGGACVKKTKSIYPSITYPAHVSMVTGCYPEKHKCYSNLAPFTPAEGDLWCWDYNYIGKDDIFSAAKRGGYSVGSVAWPVTSNHPDIDYLFPEYWPYRVGQKFFDIYAEQGVKGDVMEYTKSAVRFLAENYDCGRKANFSVFPHCDNFFLNIAEQIIEKNAPDVMFLHLCIVDNARHQNGTFNKKVDDAVRYVDYFIGHIAAAYERSGLNVENDVNFVLLSDHGQMDFQRRIKLNVYLKERGYLHTENDKIAPDWKAYALSSGMSAYVFVKDNDKEVYDKLYAELKSMADYGIYGFNKVYTREEIKEKEHLDGDFAFVLETDGYTTFSDSPVEPVLDEIDLTDYRYGKATHGYLPNKGPQPVFYAKGPDFKPGAVLENAKIIDVGPTLAALLGVEIKDTQGRALTELLNN